MSDLVFVESSGSGVNAIAYAKEAGHTVSYLYSHDFDFTAPKQQRDLARRLADHPVEVKSKRGSRGWSAEDLVAALDAAGVPLAEVRGVLSTLAFCAYDAAELAAALGARGTSAEAVATACDKAACRRAMREAGLPSVRFGVARTETEAAAAAARIGYPLIIKPVRGVAKSLTAIARTHADVRRYFVELSEASAALQDGLATHLDDRYLLEEYAVGQQYAVEVAANGGGTVALVSSAQKKSAQTDILEMGYTVPSGLGPQEQRELGAYAESVCSTIGLDLGIFHVEVILTARGPRLVEVNPRIAGGGLPQTIGAVADRDLFAVLVEIFAGDDDRPVPLIISGACSHSVLGAVSATTVRDDVPDDWLDEFTGRIHSGWTRVGPGACVPNMRGNFDPIGLIRAVGLDPAEAEGCCRTVKADVSARLGVALIDEERRQASTSPS